MPTYMNKKAKEILAAAKSESSKSGNKPKAAKKKAAKKPVDPRSARVEYTAPRKKPSGGRSGRLGDKYADPLTPAVAQSSLARGLHQGKKAVATTVRDFLRIFEGGKKKKK